MKNIKFVCLLFAVLLFQNNQVRAEEPNSPAVTEQGVQTAAEEVSTPVAEEENIPASTEEPNEVPVSEPTGQVSAEPDNSTAMEPENQTSAEEQNVSTATEPENQVKDEEQKTPSSLMAQTLSAVYGADVKLDIDGEICSLLYPGVKIEKDTPEYIAPTKPDEQPRIEHHITTTVIPETLVKCEKTEDFIGKKQYIASHNSLHKLAAQVYNWTELDFLKDVEAKTFVEEFSFVPELGVISSESLHIADASYTEKDETTGLKSEIGNLKDLTFQQSIKQNGEEVKYKADMLLDTFNLATSLFSMQIKSERQATEIDYKTGENKKFDYTEIWRNFESFVSSRSRVLAQGVKIDVSLFDFNVVFDMDAKNQGNVNENGILSSSGNFAINNIALSGEGIKEFQKLQNIKMQYTFDNLQVKEFAKIIAMQQDKMDNKEIDDNELATVLDNMIATAVMSFDSQIVFTDADFSGNIQVRREEGFLVGEGKVKISNLYNIFPELQICADPQKAKEVSECTQNSISDSFGDIVDITKNNSEVVFIINKDGIFRDGQKVGEPIEINFQKMLQEQKEKEQKIKENEAKMQQMMQEQQNMLATATATEDEKEIPTEPVAETPAGPAAETPAEPAAETPAEPAAETPAEPAETNANQQQ